MLTRTRDPDCISDLTFDRFLADGDSDEALRAGVQAHLARCAPCALRLQEITAGRDAFLRRQPSWHRLHGAHADRSACTASARREGGGRRARAAWIGGVAGALAAAAIAVIALRPTYDGAAVDSVRSKGPASIGAYLKREGTVERVMDGDAVQPGDRLRVVYSSDERVHFGLLSHDGASASVYYPLGRKSAAVEAGDDVPLDFSIRLDATGDFERLFGVFCREPVALEPLRTQLERTGRIAPPLGCHVYELVMRKRGVKR